MRLVTWLPPAPPRGRSRYKCNACRDSCCPFPAPCSWLRALGRSLLDRKASGLRGGWPTLGLAGAAGRCWALTSDPPIGSAWAARRAAFGPSPGRAQHQSARFALSSSSGQSVSGIGARRVCFRTLHALAAARRRAAVLHTRPAVPHRRHPATDWSRDRNTRPRASRGPRLVSPLSRGHLPDETGRDILRLRRGWTGQAWPACEPGWHGPSFSHGRGVAHEDGVHGKNVACIPRDSRENLC